MVVRELPPEQQAAARAKSFEEFKHLSRLYPMKPKREIFGRWFNKRERRVEPERQSDGVRNAVIRWTLITAMKN
jgi:hypothetical protein